MAGNERSRPDYLDHVVTDVETHLDRGEIPALIYNDPVVHEAELERIFGRTWVYIGHESEIPNPGDYCLRYIGDSAFIFIRDEDGEIHLFYDSCRHRGTQLCRADMGNTTHFRCPYHGWTFRADGKLIGIPAMASAYKGFDRDKWGLIAAPRLESRYGLVFASLDPDVAPLETYLGEMDWYLQMIFALGRIKVIGEPMVWKIDSNWKIGAENFGGDDYHTVTLHKSMYDLGIIPVSPSVNMFGHHVWVEGGDGTAHAVSFGVDNEPDSQLWWGLPGDVVAALDKSRLTPEQIDLARRSRTTVGTVFPNFSIIFVFQSVDPERKPAVPMLGIRVWRPTGPGQIELWSWILSWEEAPEQFVRESYECHMATFGTSGIFEQDDTEPWVTITRNNGSTFARQSGFALNYQMGLPGAGDAQPIEWPGPGQAFDTRYEEGSMRRFIGTWAKYMRQNGCSDD